ncbi:MAG: 4Fe-4S cluster-binding domain-containing protein [Dorea sp.]|jgi:hypothetical protein|nr:4Fe-4S cluster-binding domain-containing protein [Dorea sp.]
MKWSNKGHEFDEYAEQIVEDFKIRGNLIFIFGAGLIGNEIRGVLKKAGCFAGFIDNDIRKQQKGSEGAKIISFDEYLNQEKRGIIVIAADKKNIPVIANQLMEAGLESQKDFYEYLEFMDNVFPVFSVYANNQLYVDLAQISLTERCTLKCKKCAHGCYAVDMKSQDMSIETAKKSADYFFYHVDIIKEFVLIGGEPFLYQNLDRIVEYIGENYRDKIVLFSITTNGTIIPKQPLLNLCRKYDVTIRISDYSATLKHLELKYEQLKKEFENHKVSYIMGGKETKWMDYGFESVDRKGKEKELMQAFEHCKTPCREIRGSRFYYCVMARSVSENLGFGLGEDDYLELSDKRKEDKKIVLEFQQGFSEKGYLDMCNHCNGADAVNHPIPCAEQIEKWSD